MTAEPSADAKRALTLALVIDGACIFGGAAGFLLTGDWIWLVGGLLLGAGFSAPALITYFRAKR